jgi:uncharacterized protein (TIGR00369 family)
MTGPPEGLEATAEWDGGPFARAAGLRITHLAPDRVEGYVEVGPDQHQPAGLVHGGVWATVVETVGSFGAQAAVAPRGARVVGVHNSTDFVRAMRAGRAEVVAEPLHQGRSQQLWEVRITDGDGSLVAVGRLRLQNLDPDR